MSWQFHKYIKSIWILFFFFTKVFHPLNNETTLSWMFPTDVQHLSLNHGMSAWPPPHYVQKYWLPKGIYHDKDPRAQKITGPQLSKRLHRLFSHPDGAGWNELDVLSFSPYHVLSGGLCTSTCFSRHLIPWNTCINCVPAGEKSSYNWVPLWEFGSHCVESVSGRNWNHQHHHKICTYGSDQTPRRTG